MSDPIARVRFRGPKECRFAIVTPDDVVQRHLARGKFYSEDQLARHADFIVPRRTVLDIGANVGNHAIFYATFTRAERIIAFEPNPAARAVLERNLALNAIRHVEVERVGLGKAAGRGTVVAPPANLGAGRILAGRAHAADPADPAHAEAGSPGDAPAVAGDIEIRRLDDFALTGVAFVKIDVEGMEIDVLEGAARTLQANRPVIAVEVDPRNNGRFFAWCAQSRYHVVAAWRQHNPFDYICVPGF